MAKLSDEIVLKWTCPDCNTIYDYPSGARVLVIVPRWDYCPNDGHLSDRNRYTMHCNDCNFEWYVEDDWHGMTTAESVCPKCKNRVPFPQATKGVYTIKLETVETLIKPTRQIFTDDDLK